MSNPENADELRRRMDAVRNHLNADVRQVASSVRTRTSWQYYLRRYPWAVLTGAALVGFGAVPRRIEKIVPDPDMLRKMANREDLVVAPKSKASSNPGLATQVLTIALTAGARSLMGMISGKLGQRAGKKAAEQSSAEQPTTAHNTPRPK